MNLSLYIAGRYLFSKKSHQVINIISCVAIAGIALATAAMVCTLSVFNGFRSIVAEKFTAFDPEIKITPVSGKIIKTDAEEIVRATGLQQIETFSFCIEDKVMVEYGNNKAMATIKGVEENFTQLTDITDALYGPGEFLLSDGRYEYAVPGAALAHNLKCGILFTKPLNVYAPNRTAALNLTVPARNFKKGELHSAGLVFALNQPEYDNSYILTSAHFARKTLRRANNEATSLELRIKAGNNITDVKEQLQQILGNDYRVQDRYEQQEDVYKVMQIEKLISYIFLTFILLVASFNIIGSLAMLIIEKRDNMNTLRGLGAEDRTIANIFVFEGCIISAIGALAGIATGTSLCLLQQHFGLISMGSSGGFIVESYPVEIIASDVFTVFVTVIAAGFIAVWLPTKVLAKKFI